MSEGSTRPVVRLGLLSAALLALAGGCLGGQTGTEQWDPEAPNPEPGQPTNNGGEGSGCDDIEELISADDDSLGFSANDVLSFVLGQTATDLRWMPPPSGVSFGPETGVVDLDLGVSLLGRVRKVHSVPKQSTGTGMEGPAIAVQCPPDRLEVDVELEIRTAGGALAERISAELSARDRRFAELQASIELGQLSGSLAVVPADGATTKTLAISALFSESGHAGLVSGHLDTQTAEGAASHASFVYARWPADESCHAQTPVVSVPLSDPGSAGLRSALERLRAVEAAPIEWHGADAATLTLELETASVACLRPAAYGGPLGLELPVIVHVETSDGRVNSSLPGTLSGGDGNSEAKLSAFRSCEGTSAALQAEACGINHVELADFENLMLSLDATVTDRVSGALRIIGVKPTSCVSTPNSSCPGNPAEPFETGQF